MELSLDISLAAEATRPIFWHMPPWLHVLWYLLAVASVFVFAYGIYRLVAKWRAGQGGVSLSAREVPGRLWSGLRLAFSQRTVGRRDWLAGGAHALIFYGFLVLFAGTVILALQTDFTDPVFGWRYFHGDFYLVYKETLNLFGTALIAGILAMMVRRAVIRPSKLDYARPDREPGEPQYDRRVYRVGDWAFVIILLVITLTGFVLEGVRIAMEAPGYGGTQFGGWVIAQGLGGLGESTLAALRHGLWWFHGLLAIAWVASIPYTKAAHMVTSFLSLSLRDPLAGRRLKQAPAERAELPAGYATLADFRPLHLLNLDACTKCGKCHVACPANATGRPLSPRDVILELREQSNRAMEAAGIGGVLGGLLQGRAGDGGFQAPVIGADGVRVETLWSCMQCNACVEACPVGIEQAPIINLMRQHLVEEGEMEAALQQTLRTVHKSGNSFGENKRRRGRWAKELDFEVKDARKEPVELLWFVGDYASFEPRAQRVTLTIARLLHAAEVDFGILYDGERNSGNDVRRVGEEGLFEMLAEQNIASLGECEFERIVTSDPHSLNTLRNEYRDLDGAAASWPVVHHTALLLELIAAGRLELGPGLGRSVTYHDPCHLGRFNGEYEGPRQILEELGCNLVEMPRNRDQSFCCGAGGGRIWMTDAPGCERPAENRIHEAVGLGELDHFVVACPKDVVMYEDAIKTSGNEGRIELREISELVAEAVLAAPPAAVA